MLGAGKASAFKKLNDADRKTIVKLCNQCPNPWWIAFDKTVKNMLEPDAAHPPVRSIGLNKFGGNGVLPVLGKHY